MLDTKIAESLFIVSKIWELRIVNGRIFPVACFEPIKTYLKKKRKRGRGEYWTNKRVKIKTCNGNDLVNIIKTIYHARIAYRFVLTANALALRGLHSDGII